MHYAIKLESTQIKKLNELLISVYQRNQLHTEQYKEMWLYAAVKMNKHSKIHELLT